MSLAQSLERAASALERDADAIRPANGDPIQLYELLDDAGRGRLLAWMLAHEAEAADELCLDWADEDGAEALLGAVDESALPKAGRKVLRRALHRLRSRGVKVESKAAPVVGRLPQIDEDVEQAFLTPVDPSGARMVFLVESDPSGGLRLLELVMDEVRGIVDGEVYASGRSRIRKFMRELTGSGPPDGSALRPAEVEPVAARALIARIAARHPADRKLPRAYTEWGSLTEAHGPTPGETAAAALAEEGDGGGIGRAIELIEKGEVGPWPPSRDRLNAAAEQLEAEAEGALVLSEGAERDRLDGLLASLSVELFADGFADLSAERFEETAYILWKGGRTEDALACLAAARSLRHEAVDTSPVARALLEKCLAPLLERIRAKRGEEGAALVDRGSGPDGGEEP